MPQLWLSFVGEIAAFAANDLVGGGLHNHEVFIGGVSRNLPNQVRPVSAREVDRDGLLSADK